MLSGKTRRMKRLFQDDGRCLIVAMDHIGYMNKPAEGLEDAVTTIRNVVAGGADVIMTTQGTAQHAAEAIGSAGLLLSVNMSVDTVGYAVESAIRLGADGIKIMTYPWLESDPDSLLLCTCMASECEKWGLPLLSETIPGGFMAGDDMKTPERIAAGARVGAEAGADYIKTYYTGDPESFKLVVENSSVPVVILGGSKSDSDRDLLDTVRDAIDAGAVGVAMGRNIWSHENPQGITAAVAAVIHQDASVDDALKLLQ